MTRPEALSAALIRLDGSVLKAAQNLSAETGLGPLRRPWVVPRWSQPSFPLLTPVAPPVTLDQILRGIIPSHGETTEAKDP